MHSVLPWRIDMITRLKRILLIFIFGAACLGAAYLAMTVYADTPSAGKTKKAVEAADAATKKADGTWWAAAGAAAEAGSGTKYPDNEAGREATAADSYADSKEEQAESALKAAAEARLKACKSGTAEDGKAAADAEKTAREREAEADAAAADADKADAKADPYGKQLQKKKRAAGRALRAAFKAAIAAICFARQCVQLMDESSEQNKQKKQETIQTIDGLESSTNQMFALGQPARGEVQTAQGLHRISFDTLQGRVIVNLPDDMRAGDTISGSVMAEPKGQTPEERARNMSPMRDRKIQIVTGKKPDGTSDVHVEVAITATVSPFTFTLPPNSPLTLPLKSVSSGSSDGLGITLTNTSGSFNVGGSTTVPIQLVNLSLQSVVPLQVPTIGQQGRPIEIIGPFDGNTANTRLMYGPARSSIQDFEKNTENVSGGFGLIRPLAESPRKCVFEAPHNLNGPIEILIQDRLVTPTTKPFREIGVNLSAPKTNLLKGEKTTLMVEVNGLAGIDKPVPLTLESHGAITMEGGMFQPLVIQPSEVGADGRYTTARGITGVQTGAWEATATVVTLPPLIRLLDPSPPRQLLINSVTGHYDFCGGPGEKFSGDGQVKADGCSFYFFQDSNERVLMGALNACDFSNRYWVFAGGLPSATVDLRVRVDNANPPKPRVYFNQLSRPAPPVQDVSAFATCP